MSKAPEWRIEVREAGTLNADEIDYLAYIGKFIVEFSKAEHCLDEAIMSAFEYDKGLVIKISPIFPLKMDEKLHVIKKICESIEALHNFLPHIEERIQELDRALKMRNALCHGYLDLIKSQNNDTEFRFVRWRRKEKYTVERISVMPTVSQIKRYIKHTYLWKALFSEIERSLRSSGKH